MLTQGIKVAAYLNTGATGSPRALTPSASPTSKESGLLRIAGHPKQTGWKCRYTYYSLGEKKKRSCKPPCFSCLLLSQKLGTTAGTASPSISQGLLTIYSQANFKPAALARAVWDDPVAAPPSAAFPSIPECSQAAGPVKGASHRPSSSANAAYLTYSQDFLLFWSKATFNQSREDERKADTEAWLEVEVIRMLETKWKQKIQLLRSPPH